MSPRHSAIAANDTRESIIKLSVEQASINGLEGLTIGSLANSLGMSKAGLIGPFGNRLGLQLATLQQACEQFEAAIVQPALTHPAGLPRLKATLEAWIDYLADCPFPNGCFVTAAATELDGRPGPLRDRLANELQRWLGFLRQNVQQAQQEGELALELSPDDLVQQLVGIAMATNQSIQLLADDSAAQRARRLMAITLSLSQPLG
ncbi:TetR/AcrR family transcriptional regulator [Psychromicrobium lacuslunae]|uniref:TetR family transcriptional regulator n=1 Tax=Psychromicrobium lacuslunae TaxID=1618207 RepID=A0A0D4C063_9MICC|nr:TetR/AcrR family transcriptional regulator [Psychromicrobium lacuslunae]AJT42047.1 TetR family transcriptional regulator [Psychromicrobium lacuslunae]